MCKLLLLPVLGNGEMSITDNNNACECAICLSDFDEVKSVKCPWVCNHGFHEGCLMRWRSINNSCPTCRCTTVKSTAYKSPIFNRHTSGVIIHQVGNVGEFRVTLSNYKWDTRKCLECMNTRHIVTWTKPYSVLGRCTCGETQAFNYAG